VSFVLCGVNARLQIFTLTVVYVSEIGRDVCKLLYSTNNFLIMKSSYVDVTAVKLLKNIYSI